MSAVTVEQGGWISDRYHCLINDAEWSATADDIAKARHLVAKVETSCVKVGYPWLWLDESTLTTIVAHMADAPSADMCRYCDRAGFYVIEGEPHCASHARSYDVLREMTA
jgi:hypothetical protein